MEELPMEEEKEVQAILNSDRTQESKAIDIYNYVDKIMALSANGRQRRQRPPTKRQIYKIIIDRDL